MPRGLTPETLADDTIRLEPLEQRHAPGLAAQLTDADILRYTLVPTHVDPGTFTPSWIRRYEEGWGEGTRAGWAIVDPEAGTVLGFAAVVQLDTETGEGELGYLVAPEARGRGLAVRAVDLMTRWSFDELGLERLELKIDRENAASETVAVRAGYRLDGTLRSKHYKEGRRADLGIWSRLRND